MNYFLKRILVVMQGNPALEAGFPPEHITPYNIIQQFVLDCCKITTASYERPTVFEQLPNKSHASISDVAFLHTAAAAAGGDVR